LAGNGGSDLKDKYLSILRVLNHTGGRLQGRLDRSDPFVLTDAAQADKREPVEASIAGKLHEEGWIEIDESAPISDIYTFQISAAGKAYLKFASE
jgi:hypothetical protein